MNSEKVISVKNLTKIYKLYHGKKDRLKEAINPFGKIYHRDFFALNNINFGINKAGTVGIIGQNGSGKSTLLKILTGVLTQNSGTVDINGRISSLLELGAGFNPELTGMENIYFNGTIMGYSQKEMQKRIPSIIEFADIGEYVDQPVKMYSSGMFVRLAFSVAINVDPDILIVDEALSVGDIAFQMKCFDRFNKFRASGKTIIFVTHSLDLVLKYCDRVIVLNKGKVVCDDTPKKAVDVYKKIMVDCLEVDTRGHVTMENDRQKMILNKDFVRYGDNKAKIVECGIYDQSGSLVNKLINGDDFYIRFKIKFSEKVEEPIVAYTVKDVKGYEVTGTNTDIERITLPSCDVGDILNIEFKQKMNLCSGSYALSLGCVSMLNGNLIVHDRLYDAILFETVSVKSFVGLFDLKSEIKVEKKC